MSKSAGYATNNICTRVSCADAHLHHGACSCLVLSSATYSVFFAPEYVEDGGQYEVPEDVLHPVCHAGVPAWAQEASGPSIDPTRRLWGEEPSSDPIPMPITPASRKMRSLVSLRLVMTCMTDVCPAPVQVFCRTCISEASLATPSRLHLNKFFIITLKEQMMFAWLSTHLDAVALETHVSRICLVRVSGSHIWSELLAMAEWSPC